MNLDAKYRTIKNLIMIIKNSTSAIAKSWKFPILPAVMSLIVFLSFSSAFAQEDLSDQTLFSAESQKKIMEMVYANITYPSEAKQQNKTGRFFVIITMKKGGIVDQVKVNDIDKSINIPLLSYNEVVIVGYGLKNPAENLAVVGYGSAKQDERKDGKEDKRDISLLTNEGIRVARMVGSVKIPEWENKDMEFAISFNFQLKYPEEKTNTITIRDNSFQVNPDVLFMLDGKEITKQELEKLDPNSISTMSVLKGESATKVFGEKGKNGVVVITTKK